MSVYTYSNTFLSFINLLNAAPSVGKGRVLESLDELNSQSIDYIRNQFCATKGH